VCGAQYSSTEFLVGTVVSLDAGVKPIVDFWPPGREFHATVANDSGNLADLANSA
jgi:hypothetical protein